MNHLLNEVRHASDGGFYYAALYLALTIPDHCAALEAENNRTTQKRYVAWYDRHLRGNSRQGLELTGAECWSFRSRMLHQGHSEVKSKHFRRIAFVAYGENRVIIHQVNIDRDVLVLDVPVFCNALVDAAERWLDANRTNPTVVANLDRMIQPRGSMLYGKEPIKIDGLGIEYVY